MQKSEPSNNKKYMKKAIQYNKINFYKMTNKLIVLHFWIFWKIEKEFKKMWESVWAVLYLKKMIKFFFQEYLKKLTIISPLIQFFLTMFKYFIRLKKFKKWLWKLLSKNKVDL